MAGERKMKIVVDTSEAEAAIARLRKQIEDVIEIATRNGIHLHILVGITDVSSDEAAAAAQGENDATT